LARHVFYSFHYARDITRANVVRNARRVRRANEPIGYYDHSLWERRRRREMQLIKRLIDRGLKGASVTAVLIGRHTAERPWILYEIEKSYNDGMGLLGIRIHGIRNLKKQTSRAGPNPFGEVTVPGYFGRRVSLASRVAVYDWVRDNGILNAAEWIESAAQAASR
jgi:hypothetical protein